MPKRDLRAEYGEMECPWCGELRDFPFLKCPNPQCSWMSTFRPVPLWTGPEGSAKPSKPLTQAEANRQLEKFLAEYPEMREHINVMKRELGVDDDSR